MRQYKHHVVGICHSVSVANLDKHFTHRFSTISIVNRAFLYFYFLSIYPRPDPYYHLSTRTLIPSKHYNHSPLSYTHHAPFCIGSSAT